MRLCRKDQERAFVTAWAIYMTYKVHVLGEGPPKATRDQIRAIIEDRSGFVLANSQYERLLRKYVTRPGRPATRFELAVRAVKGKIVKLYKYDFIVIIRLIARPGAPGGPVAGPAAPPAHSSAA